MSLFGSKALRSALLRIGREGQNVLNDAMRRFAFEARDQIQDDVGKALEYSGSSTRNFISKFRVKYTQSRGRFVAAIYPAGPKSESLLARHVDRYRQTPADRADMTVDGKLAIPLEPAVKRGARGRIRAADRPGPLLQRDARGRSRGFVTRDGRLIMKRKGKDAVPAFALESSTVNPPQIDVHGSFGRAILTRGAAALGKALSKAMGLR